MTSNISARQRKKRAGNALIYALLVLIAIICAGPFLWLLATSFKSGQNIYSISFFTPTISNYVGVLSFMNLARNFLNSIIITGCAIALDVIFSSMCAYPLACMNFPGKKIVFGGLISTMILPASAGLIINYLTISHLHLLDTYAGVILPGSVTVFSIILMRQAYMSVPNELRDSAKIDGASELRIWSRIMLPGIRPTITTIVIFDFIANWNSFLWPVIVMQDPNKYPIATALQYLHGQFNYRFGYIAAGAIVSVIPVIIVFLAFQKNYIEAVSGAVKG